MSCDPLPSSLALSAIAVLVSLSASTASAQSTALPPNNLPNGYITVLNWAKLPDGRRFGATAGVDVAPDGSIFFSDIPMGKEGGAGMILRHDPRSGKTKVFKSDSGKSNGLMFDSAGRLLGCQGSGFGKRRVVAWDIKTGKETAIAGRQGRR